MDDTIPLWLVNTLAFITVFSVMTAIGTTVTPSECLQHLRSPSLLFRGLISVLVIVPVIGLATTSAFSLTLPEQVGITLMVIAPGAPLALRRALASGQGHSVLLPKTTSMAAWRYSAKCSNPSTGLKPRRRRSASAVLRTAASTCGAWPALVRD